MSIRGKIWLWLLFAWGVSVAWGALSENGHDVLAALLATAAIIGMLVVLSRSQSSVFGHALAPRAPMQRLGVIVLAGGIILFAAGFFGHNSIYDHAVHEIRHYHGTTLPPNLAFGWRPSAPYCGSATRCSL